MIPKFYNISSAHLKFTSLYLNICFRRQLLSHGSLNPPICYRYFQAPTIRRLVVENTKQFVQTYDRRMLCYSITSWSCNNCQKCNSKTYLICSKCGVIVDPEQLKLFNYYDIFDIDKTYDINVIKLAKHFKSLQWILHPDKFANKNKVQEEHSQLVSAAINMAYQTLLKPASRAAYLLELNGQPFDEHSAKMDHQFLLQVMEMNEALSECNSLEDAKKMKRENDKRLDEQYESISKCFKEKDFDGASLCLGKINYFENLNEKLKDLIMNLS